MATDNITTALFGGAMLPEDMQQQLIRQRAAEFAQLTPSQQLAQAQYTMSANAGQGLAQAMGVDIRDPALKLQSKLTALSQGIPQTAEGLIEYSRRLSADPSIPTVYASQAMDKARAIKEQEAKTSSEGLTGKLAIAGKYTPESLAKYGVSGKLSDLEAIDLSSKPSADWLAVAKELGLPAGRSFNDYTPEQVGAVNTKLFNQGVQKAQAGRATTVFQQESAFSKARGEAQAKAVEAASNDARAASQSLDRLGEMKRLAADPKLYTGPLANPTVAATNLLQGFGLVSPEQARQLANAEMYQKYANDVTFQELNGKLGGNVSNNDVEFIKSRLPQLTTSSKARMELINKLEEIQKGKIAYYEKMNAHANKYNNLNDFKFAEPTNKTVKWSDLQ